MRGAAAGGSEKKSVPAGCAAPRKDKCRNEQGGEPEGARPAAGSGPMQNGDRAVAHAGGRDQTKRFISEKSKSFSISPSAEKV